MSGSESVFVSVAVPRPFFQSFTYRIPHELLAEARVGRCVKVPFGRTSCNGVIVSETYAASAAPAIAGEIKSILSVGDAQSEIPPEIMKLSQWASDYYFSPLGEILQAASAPAHLKKSKRAPRERELLVPHFNKLSQEQQEAFDSIWNLSRGNHRTNPVVLLEGVTGSGKTEVYFHLAKKTLEEGRGVLFLVPEIALTPQLFERFRRALGDNVCLWHSALADGLRRKSWDDVVDGRVRAVVGARSAVFAPIKNLGLIVIDEEHDSTYKQEERFRYHARDLAIVRGQQASALVVLGSATPSWETLERVRDGKYHSYQIKSRFGVARDPEIKIVSLLEKDQWVDGLRTPMHRQTLLAIQETIDRGEQVMVYLNRRGWAQFLICKDCGHIENCEHCSISLTLHKKQNVLKCHQCGFKRAIPDHCSKCASLELDAMGSGTETLEEEFSGLIKDFRPVRLDRDQVTSEKRLTDLLNKFRSGEANVLLGTQMIVKGHDFPRVTLVVVVLADMLFRFPDFRSPERAFQVLTQVSGRSGRSDLPGRVLIQTFQPEYPLLEVLKQPQTWKEWYEAEREMRVALTYPPFSRMVRLRIESADSSQAREFAVSLTDSLSEQLKNDGEVLGPSEAFIRRIKGKYRWDIVLKCRRYEALQSLVRFSIQKAREGKFSLLVDVDPHGLG